MEKRIIDLEIVDDLETSGVDAIALVDSPAIEKNFMYFRAEQFVEPQSGETQSEYMGRCISNATDEGYPQDQAVAMCISKWETHAKFEAEVFADYPWDQCIQDQLDKGLDQEAANNICGLIRSQNMSVQKFAKVSFDFDDTLSTGAGLVLAKKYKDAGDTLYIISARNEVSQSMLDRASELGIPESRVHATGSNKAKVEEVKKLGITKHIDNNADVVKELGSIGEKFGIDTGSLSPYTDQTGPLKRKAVLAEDRTVGTYGFTKLMFADDDKMELVGPVAIPDMQIPRKDKEGNVYFVRFSKDVVKKMAEKFMREQRLADNNIQHVDSKDAGTYVFESWLVENPEDKANSVYGLNVPLGTWCVKMRVLNNETWQEVKAGKLKGFSLQGNFLSQDEYAAYLKDKKVYEDLVKLVSTL